MRAIILLVSLFACSTCNAQLYDGYGRGARYGAAIVGRYHRSSSAFVNRYSRFGDSYLGVSRAHAKIQYVRASRGSQMNNTYWKYIRRGDIAGAVRVMEAASAYGLDLRPVDRRASYGPGR